MKGLKDLNTKSAHLIDEKFKTSICIFWRILKPMERI